MWDLISASKQNTFRKISSGIDSSPRNHEDLIGNYFINNENHSFFYNEIENMNTQDFVKHAAPSIIAMELSMQE